MTRNMLNPSLWLPRCSLSCKIIDNYSTSWLTRILKYSNPRKISIGLLRIIFMLLLMKYWLHWLKPISTSCCCGSHTLNWWLLMMNSVWIWMTSTSWHKINHSLHWLWLFTRLGSRKHRATELWNWWFHSNTWVSTWFPNG